MGKHISDTRKMCGEIYYIHLQSSHTLLLHQPKGTLQWQKSLDKYTETDRDRITKNNGCLATPANNQQRYQPNISKIQCITKYNILKRD